MTSIHRTTIRNLTMILALGLLGGCSVHASAKAGSGTDYRSASSSRVKSTESTRKTSGSEQVARRDAQLEDDDSKADKAAPVESKQPVADRGSRPDDQDADRVEDSNRGKSKKKLTAKVTPAPSPAVAAESTAASDKDRGHGNDADGVDEDNPGNSKKKPSKAKPAPSAATTVASNSPADHDRGHGNDADGVDEDNPGKSKK